MIDPKTILVFLRATLDRVAKFDYKRLVPRVRVSKYLYAVGGIETTWPLRREEDGWVAGEGFGLGLGLGKHDIWVGWPRRLEDFGGKIVTVVKVPQDEILAMMASKKQVAA